MLPRLRQLERKYARELVVIGVHSAKFTGEKSTEAVRQAVLRLSVGHPVVNDRDFRVWQQYAVRAWPTLMFIDPRGKVIARHEGEFPVDRMDSAIGQLLAQFEADGSLDRRPLSFTSERENEPDRPLFFPGKLLADSRSDRLFVSDSGHHRIVEIGLADGAVRRIFGSGQPGLADGPADRSRFNAPQGLALQGEQLFVADTENHAVRRIDLGSSAVETLAGTGEQAPQYHRGGQGRQVLLNSPWDLVAHDGRLFVAMAGFHQIWEIQTSDGLSVPFAGSGRENILDGSLEEAQLAQPSGLALDAAADLLYVADSEVSGVRSVELLPGGQVRTLVGQGLFEFGDVDGVGEAVRLQHPLGLVFDSGLVYIADSYNHKIKRLWPASTTVQSFLGSGDPGHHDASATEASFSEPGGLSVANGRLYVADTNNHAVRSADLTTGVVETFVLRGL